MQTQVWMESGADQARETLRQEARMWHALHQPPRQMEDWQALRSQLLRSLREAAGSFPESCPLDVREYGTSEHDGYCIKRLSYQSRPDFRVTDNLYMPHGPGPFPAILGTHGHWLPGSWTRVWPLADTRLLKMGLSV